MGWAIIAYVLLFRRCCRRCFYIRGVEIIGGNRAGLFINLLPVWGALLAVVISAGISGLSRHLLVLVLSGVLVAEIKDGRRRASGART